MKTEFITRVITLILVLFTSQAFAAEVRTWTDLKGRSFEGTFIRADEEEVTIQQKGGGQVQVKRAILSALDNQWLAEYTKVGSAIVEGAKVGTPEKSVKIDSKQFKTLDDVFIFPDTEIDFKMLESDHFITMTHGRIRPKDIAETAERLWHGMAFQHPGFAEKWGDKRRAIFVCEDEADEEVHAAVGRYFINYLFTNGQEQESENTRKTWPKSAGSTIILSPEIADEHDLFQRARVFRVTKQNEQTFKKVFTPFVTHCLASDMLTTQAGGTSSFGGDGYFSIVTGHAYYKEILLAGRVGTSLLDAQYGDDEVGSAKGFEDGSSWAKELRKMVKRDDVNPSIAEVYKYQVIGLKPTQLVLLYSLSYYMQSTPERLAAYTKMIERIETSKQVPAAIEIAKLYGFETAEEFEADWKAFIESRDFK